MFFFAVFFLQWFPFFTLLTPRYATATRANQTNIPVLDSALRPPTQNLRRVPGAYEPLWFTEFEVFFGGFDRIVRPPSIPNKRTEGGPFQRPTFLESYFAGTGRLSADDQDGRAARFPKRCRCLPPSRARDSSSHAVPPSCQRFALFSPFLLLLFLFLFSISLALGHVRATIHQSVIRLPRTARCQQ